MNDNFKIIMLVSVLLAALAGCQLPPGPGGPGPGPHGPHPFAETTSSVDLVQH
ncbi:hypothetical protein [Vibrio marisflavi]|uniref:Lipoprotein n=1 Tax=Vibrio marisflavi CECT 7928 TaxID=634439 RepID=A0ABM8ZZF7_9VIBR|nr:hypothetical protein [Vibrio marisflavi]CAH0536481.1 hypothetical protein VMF7928_00444 [Vibrio marisflavi CECT 7928]